MGSIISTKGVIEHMTQLADEEREEMMRTGAKPDDVMVGNMVDKAMVDVDPDAALRSLMADVAARKLKSNMKRHDWKAALKDDGQNGLFPDGLDNSTLSIGGISMPFVEAGSTAIDDQREALIDNKVRQDEAFARGMNTLNPICALTREQDITAGEALNILRSR